MEIYLFLTIDIDSFYFQLIFDNYTATPHPSDVLPASSRSKKAHVAVDHVATSSSKNSLEDL